MSGNKDIRRIVVLAGAGMLLVTAAIYICLAGSSSRKLVSLSEMSLKEISTQVLASISDPGGMAVGMNGSLGQRIQSFDEKATTGDWKAMYEFRFPQWQKSVSYDAWSKGQLASIRRIREIDVLSASAIARQGSPANAFQIIKQAIIETSPEKFSRKFYVEIWIYQGNWFYAGGAPWDEPSLPILGLIMN